MARSSGLSATARSTTWSTVTGAEAGGGWANAIPPPASRPTGRLRTTTMSCRMLTPLPDRNRKRRRTFSGRAVPGHGHLPRAPVWEIDGAEIPAGRLVGRHCRAGHHRRHAGHTHAGAERHLAGIERLPRGRRELEHKSVLARLPLPRLALERDHRVLGLLCLYGRELG